MIDRHPSVFELGGGISEEDPGSADIGVRGGSLGPFNGLAERNGFSIEENPY